MRARKTRLKIEDFERRRANATALGEQLYRVRLPYFTNPHPESEEQIRVLKWKHLPGLTIEYHSFPWRKYLPDSL